MGIDISGYTGGILRAESIARLFPGVVQNFLASPLLGVIGIAQAAGRALGDMLTGALGQGLKLAADYEQAEISLTTMLGSAERAKSLLGELSSFAASTPFEFPELVAATTKLVAFGTEQAKILPTLTTLGDVAAGVNQ